MANYGHSKKQGLLKARRKYNKWSKSMENHLIHLKTRTDHTDREIADILGTTTKKVRYKANQMRDKGLLER